METPIDLFFVFKFEITDAIFYEIYFLKLNMFDKFMDLCCASQIKTDDL